MSRLANLARRWPPLARALDQHLSPLVLLAARLWLVGVFWAAAQVRLLNWDSQMFLFESVHPLPLLPPALWAMLTTSAELTLPALLLLGLGTRLGALGLLAMTMVIQFYLGHLLQSDYAMPMDFDKSEHYLWMLLCLLLLAQGGGRWSLDHRLFR